ncbi:unnamed protein product [Ectocarpus sp. 12 AP-2014]
MAGTPSGEDVEGRLLAPLSTLLASELCLRQTDRAFHDIRRLANILSRVNHDSRREDLLDYIRSNRARFLKAYAIISWLSGNYGELVANASNALAEARSQREQIDACQDQFFFMHGGLFGARQRLYDVPVAVDVLIGGRYPHLPKGIEYCGGDIDPRPIFELPANREEIVLRVDRAIRLALLRRGGVPSQFTSHTVKNGVLTLTVNGEFELMVTLQAEREDARWALLGITLLVQAREGESITAPVRDFRQQRYLHEVIQKAMDVHADGDANPRPNALLAAYQVCHDLCCSMVLEILHAQAQKLATRVGGLWAAQLAVMFHKDSQVLDLCLWQREFSVGLGGTGRDVGVGGVRVGEAPLRREQVAPGSRLKATEAEDSLPPPPVGCRYLRVHRPMDRNSQIVASLGPPVELLERGGLGSDVGDHSVTTDEETAAVDSLLTSSVQIYPDKLSCARMLLAAARLFASQKINTLAADVESYAAQLGTCVPRVTTVGGLSAFICPWGGGGVEVSVDVKSGRYLVKDTLPGGGKAMASCISRLREALNLLPLTDSQSLGESIASTLSAGRSVLQKRSLPTQRNGEQDLRQQHVRRCMGESFGLLRRGELEHTFRCAFGVVPHLRWQALLGRTDTNVIDAGTEFPRLDGSDTLRSSVRLGQFRENGVLLSEAWRKRTRNFRILRRGTSAIELTRAERAATIGQVPTAASAGAALRLNSALPLDGDLSCSSGWQQGGGTLPAALAESLAEVSDGGDDMASRSTRWRTDRGMGPGANGVKASSEGNVLEETGEMLSFFLEVDITGILDVEHTVVSATLPTAGRARKSLRPVVGETYQLFPCQPLSGSRCGSLDADLLPSEPPPAVGTKRSASCLDADYPQGANGIAKVVHDGLCPTLHAAVGTVEASQTQLCTAVQMCNRFVPFARLQHAFLRVGTGLSLDFRELTHFSGGTQQVPHCAVFLAGEHGWSSPEVAASSARVSFFPGHTQADTWEWDVTLGPTTSLMDFIWAVPAKDEETGLAVANGVVHEQLPLAHHIEIRGVRQEDTESSSTTRMAQGKHIRFRFPPPFSVHAMCRSFALAGEGLTVMQTLATQASMLRQTGCEGAGYSVVSCSPIHVAMRDSKLDHVVLLTHSAFSSRHISSADRPGLVLIPWPHAPTCPAAMRELEASVRKHRDLSALLHGLSRTVPVMAEVSRVLPGVGSAAGMNGDRSPARGEFVLTAVTPARFVLSKSPLGGRRSQSKPALTLAVEASGQVRVSTPGRKDVVTDTGALRRLLLEWIASTSE